ncbi:hypothetical protein KQX54_008851 [Cotesia glomerata]|uniref:Uncharacterized protein n=1 Tax=Cotesia glomerata TaxID=32391 RepID=A0AAV7J2F6_COTGL|nr:hypothetical protein KQX54_008851 [Cotesia glomerata]
MRLDVVVINRQSDRAHFLGMYACLSASGGPFSSGMLCCLMRIQYNIIIYIILVLRLHTLNPHLFPVPSSQPGIFGGVKWNGKPEGYNRRKPTARTQTTEQIWRFAANKRVLYGKKVIAMSLALGLLRIANHFFHMNPRL